MPLTKAPSAAPQPNISTTGKYRRISTGRLTTASVQELETAKALIEEQLAAAVAVAKQKTFPPRLSPYSDDDLHIGMQVAAAVRDSTTGAMKLVGVRIIDVGKWASGKVTYDLERLNKEEGRSPGIKQSSDLFPLEMLPQP